MKRAWFLGVALGLLGLSWWPIRDVRDTHARYRREAAELHVPTMDAVFATRDLLPGAPIGAGDVTVRRAAAVSGSEDAVFRTVGEVVGQVPRGRILAGEVVRAERLGYRPLREGHGELTVAVSNPEALVGIGSVGSGSVALIAPDGTIFGGLAVRGVRDRAISVELPLASASALSAFPHGALEVRAEGVPDEAAEPPVTGP